MRQTNFYHAYLASLGLRYGETPEEFQTFSQAIHDEWANVPPARVRRAFRVGNKPPTNPKPPNSTLEGFLRECLWSEDPPRLHLIRVWELILSDRPNSTTESPNPTTLRHPAT